MAITFVNKMEGKDVLKAFALAYEYGINNVSSLLLVSITGG